MTNQILRLVTLLTLVLLNDMQAAWAVAATSLAGSWRFELDREDTGLKDRWFERVLPLSIELPGALQNQGFGDDIAVNTRWTGDVASDRWKNRPEYEKYRQPGNIKVPFFLQPQKHYVGTAWYQRDIQIPETWTGKRVVLTLERPHWGTHVWLNDQLIGTTNSLCTPHVYELGVNLRPGKHNLTLRVDNRVLVEVGDWAHSVSDHTQGNWNGIIGRIEVSATEPVWIDAVQVFPEFPSELQFPLKSGCKLRVQVEVGNRTGKPFPASLQLNPGGPQSTVALEASVVVPPEGLTHEFVVPALAGLQLWDEFTPSLCDLDVRLVSNGEGNSRGRETDRYQVRWGARSITGANRQFFVNSRPVFFRGTLECCIFPKTGYPPTDGASWERIIRICKEHGLNHMRFHSWCPPEAAFTAADELGFYFQVECGAWTHPGNGTPIDQWLYDESRRIVRAYGNHPSFVLLTHGNEPHGPNREKYLAQWVEYWKHDGRFLVTSGSAYPQLPENQYHVYHASRGPHGWLGKDYRKDVEKLDVPVIVHEMGQWCVYPNFDEVSKYTGPLKPKNFDIFRDSLEAHGMLDQWKDFLQASGKLQVLCYKEEMEAALRTPGIGGIQLLDLHDFPGQGTALVGVLDPFWEEKGYVEPEEFRRFCSSMVPLARLLKRNWTTTETLTCDVELANYRSAPIPDAGTTWKLVAQNGKVAAQGEFPDKDLPLGQNIALGKISADLANLNAPNMYCLEVAVADGAGNPLARNDWNVWIYPAAPSTPLTTDLMVTSWPDETAFEKLEAGGSVVLFANKLSSMHPKLHFEPIFWNRYMFHTQPQQTLGLLCQAKHPALEQFPTESFQDWQWQDIVTHARGMVMDDLPKALRPIVQPIDDWNTNRRLGLLFECRVGKGKLLVCSADLDKELDQRPAARQLRNSLLTYAAGEQFNPKVEVAKDDLRNMLERNRSSKLLRLGATILSVNSEDTASGNVATNAIDGDVETIWHTRWQPIADPMPHQLAIDLGREIVLKGFTYLPRQEMSNGRIADVDILCSVDNKDWDWIKSVKWPDSGELQSVQFKQPIKARYLKLVTKAEINGKPFASIAELDVLMDE
ncbi:MAG: discoidin domain-containing protein [Candidatus Sumerlaeaceae bacterium]